MTKTNVRHGVRIIRPTLGTMFGKQFNITIKNNINATLAASQIMGQIFKSMASPIIVMDEAMVRNDMGKRKRNRQRQKGERKYGNESQKDFEKRVAAENVADDKKLYFDLPTDIKLPTLWEARNA